MKRIYLFLSWALADNGEKGVKIMLNHLGLTDKQSVVFLSLSATFFGAAAGAKIVALAFVIHRHHEHDVYTTVCLLLCIAMDLWLVETCVSLAGEQV